MIRLPLLLVLSAAVIGCGSAKPDPQVAELQKQIAELSARIEQLESNGSQIDTAETTQFGDVVADRLFVKTIMVVDENSKPRICLSTEKMINRTFRAVAANPSILLDASGHSGFGGSNLEMWNGAGKLGISLSSSSPGGSVSVKSAEKDKGSFQIHSGISGPELRRYPADGNWINLKQVPVDNSETDVR